MKPDVEAVNVDVDVNVDVEAPDVNADFGVDINANNVVRTLQLRSYVESPPIPELSVTVRYTGLLRSGPLSFNRVMQSVTSMLRKPVVGGGRRKFRRRRKRYTENVQVQTLQRSALAGRQCSLVIHQVVS